jgi:ornithine cyclodeaminase
MRVLTLEEIRPLIDDLKVIDAMRGALIAQSRGECDTPMPMHLATGRGEVHMKSSYRRGGKHFVLKMASTFDGVGDGMMLLASAETGRPVAYLADAGHLTDVRTAAVSAMIARELGRADRTIGILGSGIQARLTARFHARVLPLEQIYLWGRHPERVERCAKEISAFVKKVAILPSPSALAAATRLIVTCTASRAPLLMKRDLQAGVHVSAVGADSAGKQELDPEILRAADLLLVDSLRQCEMLGELQHAPDQRRRAVEVGKFLQEPRPAPDTSGLKQTVADLTGLGVEDLFIAEAALEREQFLKGLLDAN